MLPFKQVVLGGTFDLLHAGHHKLLHKAFEIGQFVVIGLTSDSFNKSRHKQTFQNYEIRKRALIKFLQQSGYQSRFHILPIHDLYGQADTNSQLEAIIVTPETRSNAHLINKNRIKMKLKPLFIIEVSHSLDQKRYRVSSTRIRAGEITPDGHDFVSLLEKIADTPLSETVKSHFKSPLGKLLSQPPKRSGKIITVGDITSHTFLKHGIIPNLVIIDLKTKRDHQFDNILDVGFADNDYKKIPNPAGMITSKLIKAVHLTKKSLIVVEGEEDLAVIPSVLLSPLGTYVYYGQPDEGLVEVKVTPEIKQELLEKLNLA
jgi:cytidyltransferase-like protein